ncbi:hypothetical protein M407DRAFT_26111 [Tulasnella calospora MUT 4182]|uniref:C2H2-type domain-containing protein n=1 Tax=Tulasnella calospora MUT 4182 TaxID=1051891 RepID=A0A0C3KSQ3_9AGAM|nr:hypothetical protein M407DRAFT_26111 [Tulasnella calospora MUT 4182]
MPSCQDCGKSLATAAGLRHHINSLHVQIDYHECECEKVFFTPEGLSRRRDMLSKSFSCPAWGCDYKSSRKASAKRHVRLRHPDLLEYEEIVIFPPRTGSSGHSASDAGFGPDPSPMPGPVPVIPFILQPLEDLTDSWSSDDFDPMVYWTDNPPQDWTDDEESS